MAGAFRTMVSMEMDDESKEDAAMPIAMPEKPDFPYGLRICLTKREFEKLGLDPADAELGGICHGHFMARVTSVSMNQSEYSPDGDCRVELQIEDLAIESEDAENEDAANG